MPLISIITINLNNKDGLTQTISSVRNQNFKDFEYIVIDGKSHDGSVDIIHQNKDIISYWVSEPDQGIYHAMNKGILASKGTYLLFLNSGDFLEDKNVLSKVSNILKKGYSIVYGNIHVIPKNGTVKLVKFPSRITSCYMKIKFVSHQATFTKRQTLIDSNLYDESFAIAADTAFLIKAIFYYNVSYKYTDTIIARFNNDGISSMQKNRKTVFDERDRALKLYLPRWKYNFLQLVKPFLMLYWGIYRRIFLS